MHERPLCFLAKVDIVVFYSGGRFRWRHGIVLELEKGDLDLR